MVQMQCPTSKTPWTTLTQVAVLHKIDKLGDIGGVPSHMQYNPSAARWNCRIILRLCNIRYVLCTYVDGLHKNILRPGDSRLNLENNVDGQRDTYIWSFHHRPHNNWGMHDARAAWIYYTIYVLATSITTTINNIIMTMIIITIIVSITTITRGPNMSLIVVHCSEKSTSIVHCCPTALL